MTYHNPLEFAQLIIDGYKCERCGEMIGRLRFLLRGGLCENCWAKLTEIEKQEIRLKPGEDQP